MTDGHDVVDGAPRAQSLRQAWTCETAKGKDCKCRCGGELHGRSRVGDPGDLIGLPREDPHFARPSGPFKPEPGEHLWCYKCGHAMTIHDELGCQRKKCKCETKVDRRKQVVVPESKELTRPLDMGLVRSE